MKSNTTNAAVAFLMVGLAGFFVGKMTRMSEYAMLHSAWAEVDPTAALDYTINTRDEDTRSSMVATVLAAWASRDPESAKQWISSQSDVRLKDDATRLLAKELAMTDPAGTASWLLANHRGLNSTHSVMEVVAGSIPARATTSTPH